eukprot:scaffold36122_cov31-Tisochrysis_lutea.AAC.2
MPHEQAVVWLPHHGAIGRWHRILLAKACARTPARTWLTPRSVVPHCPEDAQTDAPTDNIGPERPCATRAEGELEGAAPPPHKSNGQHLTTADTRSSVHQRCAAHCSHCRGAVPATVTTQCTQEKGVAHAPRARTPLPLAHRTPARARGEGGGSAEACGAVL